MFCHDPESWKEMWVGRSTAQGTTGRDLADNPGDFNGAVFPPDRVKFESTLIQVNSEGESGVWLLVWSITRLC